MFIKILLLSILFNSAFNMTAIELVDLIDNRPIPNDIKSLNTMKIINKKGREKNLELITKSKDNSERQMIWFISPPDDKGMSFLKIEYDDKDDLMKMWLPGFKKFRRISSTKKSDSFMGSDLSFEDLTNRNKEDYDYKIISSEDKCSYKNSEYNCYKLESSPKIKSSYSKHLTWVINLNNVYIAIKEHSFDANGDLLKIKEIQFQEIKNQESTYYIMNNLFVQNVQKNTSTSLSVNDIEINLGIDNSYFNDMNLKRLP